MSQRPRLREIGPRLARVDTAIAKAPGREVDPIYRSSDWRALVTSLMAERGHRCEDCGRADCRIYGDHVVELRDGGAPLDPANVRLLCGACHAAKTIAARARRFARPSRPD